MDKRKTGGIRKKLPFTPPQNIVPVNEVCDEDETTQTSDRTMDDKSDMILEELVQNSMRNDLLESCERAWFNALGEKPDLIPPDSDEGSLSSGCESASTVTSDCEQAPIFPTISEEFPQEAVSSENRHCKKTDPDFKVGGCVLARASSFEKVNSDILKYCGLNYSKNNSILGNDEVSLIPVGESQSDFSSLKVFKKKNAPDPPRDVAFFEEQDGGGSEDENDSACSDESGYEEEELTSSVANIVLV